MRKTSQGTVKILVFNLLHSLPLRSDSIHCVWAGTKVGGIWGLCPLFIWGTLRK